MKRSAKSLMIVLVLGSLGASIGFGLWIAYSGWRELHAADGKTAMDFYASQFGWTEDRQHDMGPMGVYRIFKAGDQEGGMMTKAAQGPGPCWVYYFIVDAAGAANARVTGKGGKILNGPHPVPGGMYASQCADPEGALFGLVSVMP